MQLMIFMDIRKRTVENGKFSSSPFSQKMFYLSIRAVEAINVVGTRVNEAYSTRSYNRLEFIIISDKLTLNSQYIFYFRCSSISSSQQFGDR